MTTNTYTERPVGDYAAIVGSDGQLVDVRQPEELFSGVLPGARSIPLGEVPARLEELDPGRRVVLVCRSGGRSAQAAAFLAGRGFGDVVNLAGGMLAFDGPVDRAPRSL